MRFCGVSRSGGNNLRRCAVFGKIGEAEGTHISSQPAFRFPSGTKLCQSVPNVRNCWRDLADRQALSGREAFACRSEGEIMRISIRGSMAALVLLAFAGVTVAAEMTPERKAEKVKVETALALAKIAEATGDGDALLVAARLLSSVGPVAVAGARRGRRRSAPIPPRRTASRFARLRTREATGRSPTATGITATRPGSSSEPARTPRDVRHRTA